VRGLRLIAFLVAGAFAKMVWGRCVHTSVPSHIAEDAEAASTAFEGTGKWFFSRVTVEVYLQTAGSIKPFTAVAALVFGN